MISNYGKYIGRDRVALTSEYPSSRLLPHTLSSRAYPSDRKPAGDEAH